MAFLLLGMGLMMGATAIALSESERDYYYGSRSMMIFIGNRDGADIFKDPVNGVYYVDNGWEVRRVGTAGFQPHPVYKERFKQLSMKYNPSNLKWTDFILASFEGREQELWNNFFTKYEVGAKPTEPTWGKGIRKARWSQYENDLDAWNDKVKQLTPKFKEECRMWDEQKKRYDADNAYSNGSFAGKALLQRALSGGNVILVQQQPPVAVVGGNTTQMYRAVVPPGKMPGDQFLARAGTQTMLVTVPPGVSAGTAISFVGPASTTPVAQATAVPASTQLPARKASNSNGGGGGGATRSSVPPQPPPPAIGMPSQASSAGKSYSFGGKYPSVG